MQKSGMFISIPVELEQYRMVSKFMEEKEESFAPVNFGVKLIKNSLGNVECAIHYDDNGEVVKKVFYNGSTVSCVKYFRNEKLYYKEEYKNDLVQKKIKYNFCGHITSSINYEYNKLEKVIGIQKETEQGLYEGKYGYDELNRVNNRRLYYNSKIINDQRYRFDILDRISEYKDINQKINVHQIGQKNELIHYTITDKIGNRVSVVNYFNDVEYKYTEITLNGHTTSLRDIGYADNIMLKRPYTSEDDIDMIISCLFQTQTERTKRTGHADISDEITEQKIKYRTLPISIRKRLLFTPATSWQVFFILQTKKYIV